MLVCPFCKDKFTVNQGLALHMARHHKPEWKGTIARSIPAGIDIGFPDPKAVAARTARVNATIQAKRNGRQLKRQKSWYKSLTRAQLDKRNNKQRERRLAKMRAEGRPLRVHRPPTKTWECPYCDFSTTGYGGNTRHLKAFHPNETGLARFERKAVEVVNKIDRMVPVENGIENKIIAAVAELIYRDLKKE